jgi:hypothetical protein
MAQFYLKDMEVYYRPRMFCIYSLGLLDARHHSEYLNFSAEKYQLCNIEFTLRKNIINLLVIIIIIVFLQCTVTGNLFYRHVYTVLLFLFRCYLFVLTV